MAGFGSNWYQMHGRVLAWRWHMVGFGSNCYHIHRRVIASRRHMVGFGSNCYHTICLSFCNNRQIVRDIDVNAM